MSSEKKILLIIPTSLVMLLVTVSVIIACVGSPQPPVCGNAIFLGKFITETAVAGVETTIPTGLVPYVSWFVEEEGTTGESCPAPNFASVTLSYVCTPDDGSPAFVIGPQMFTLDTPTVPGFQPPGGTTVPFAVPAGTPPSSCVIEGTYDVTFPTAGGGLGLLSDTGDAEIFFVPPSPDDPTLPIVSMEVLTLDDEAGKTNNGAGGVFSGYQGDQQLFFLVLENNDLSREATFVIDGEAIQAAGYADGFTDDESAYNGGNYRISDPNDAFSTVFFDETPPGSLPNTPGGSKRSGVQIETEITLGPGEVGLIGMAQRSFGACANGSCNENQFSATVTLADASGAGKTMDDTVLIGASFATPVDTENQAPGYPGLTVEDAIKMNPDYDAFWTYTEILDADGDKIDEMHGSNLLPAERQPSERFGIRTSGETIRNENNSPWPLTWKDQITVDGITFDIGARWASFGGYGFDGFSLRTTAMTVTGIDPLQGDCVIPHISQANANINVEIAFNGGCGNDALVSIDGAPMGTLGDLRGNPAYLVDDASCHTLSFPFGNLSDAPVLVADPPFMDFNVTDKQPFITFVDVTDMEGNAQDWEVTVEGPGADAITPLNPIGNGQAQIEVDPSGLEPLSTLETTLVFTNPDAVNSPLRVPLVVRCPPQQLLTPVIEFDGPGLFPPGAPIEINTTLNAPLPPESFFDPTFLIEMEGPNISFDVEVFNDPPTNSIPSSDPGFNNLVQPVFGDEAVNRCADPNTSCQLVEFGGPFVQLNFIIALEGLFPERNSGVGYIIVHGTASNATVSQAQHDFVVTGPEGEVVIQSLEEFILAKEIFDDFSLPDDATFHIMPKAADLLWGIQQSLEFVDPRRYFIGARLRFANTPKRAAGAFEVGVTFDGTNCPPPCSGLTFAGGSSTVDGIRIQHVPDHGLVLLGEGGHAAKAMEFAGNEAGGVLINSSGNLLGGALEDANLFEANGGPAIVVAGGTGNRIQYNTFPGNGRLAIDLGSDGLTPNDPGDADTGPNNLQNYPVLTTVLPGSSTTTVEGTLDSTPNSTFQVQFFASDDSTTRANEFFLGEADVTTGADGLISFSVVVDSTARIGQVVTATATDAEGNTSEFSAFLAVVTGVASEDAEAVPSQFALAQNYPNPFNPSTTIAYAVPQAGRVRLAVFDLLGRLVTVLVDERKAAGHYAVAFDASGLPSGTYLYQMTGDGFTQTRPLILIK